MAGDARLLKDVAIIDLRGNQNPGRRHHANWRSWAMRERLDRANGHQDNQVIWAFTPGLSPLAALARQSFLTMDSWLARGRGGHVGAHSREKIVANKPTRPGRSLPADRPVRPTRS
jgi:hypothetical protein